MDFGTLILYRRGEQPQPFRLRLGSLSIGSDPSADISVEDGLLERFHARVVCTPAGCQLTDLGSKSGIAVNKERLQAHRPHMLRDGDRVQLGRVGLLYSGPAARAKPTAVVESASVPAQASAVAEEPSTVAEEPSGVAEGPSAVAEGPSAVAEGPSAVAEGPSGVAEEPSAVAEEPSPSGDKEVRPPQPTKGSADPQRQLQPANVKPVQPEGPTPSRATPVAPVARGGATAQAAVVADEWDALFQIPSAPTPGVATTRLQGNRRRRPRHDERDLPYEAEDYLALLPPIYHDDRFMRQFLLIFKASLDPIDRQIAQIYHYFDPRTAPEHLLPWLAAWVDLVLDERWPEARRRELIHSASVLYRWRGTRRGLGDYLRIYTGVEPRIVEQGQERRGEAPLPPHTFRVIIEAPDLATIDRELVQRIIELEKPAHTDYQLELRTP